ncbi:MAG: SspB family protein [Pseudomonadota bacterium]|uniref:SspB family protein n=1 Tax=Fodinicurvata fenggangensis TaxID=1121830 RepID=UPI00047EB462|nr:ClpXP protease specificity-enhancing factor SspB [Fodinicurvata fenggangensis]
MSDEILRYDLMVENALRGVVRAALQEAATEGLPGEHHFYITFQTEHEGVHIPDRLKERYPEEMTIVLQHRFWDLEVREDGFSVTLTFNEIPENLVVPYEAVTAFADPSVRFGLQFGNSIEADEEIDLNNPLDEDMPEAPAQDGTEQAAQAEDLSESAGEKVVTLDQFRKKS